MFAFPLRLERLEDRQLLATVTWIGPSGGLWSTPGNWDSGVLPTSQDDVVIDIAGAATIVHSTGTDTVHSITSQETLNLTGGTLNVVADIQGAGGITLSGGTLGQATVRQKITGTTSGGTLSGVTLKGDAGQTQPTVIDLVGAPRHIDVTGDLTLDNASINIQGGAALGMKSAIASLAGTGSLVFADSNASSSVYMKASGGQMTIGPGIAIKGAGGTIGYSSAYSGPSDISVVNQGTVGPTQTGTMTLTGASWNNQGTLQALGGGTLTIQPTTWSNTGLITETNSTLNLASTFTTAQLGQFSRSGGTVNLMGTLDNTGSALHLTAATGSLVVFGGTILGGTVLASDGARLLANVEITPYIFCTLNGVTLQGDVAQTQPTVLDIGGYFLTTRVIGDLRLDNASISIQNGGSLGFSGAATTLTGSGAVVFGDNRDTNSVHPETSGGQLTIGPGITIKGVGGSIGYNLGVVGSPSNVSIVNQGTIGPTQLGTIHVNGASVTNLGTFQATGGGTLWVGLLEATNLQNQGVLTTRSGGQFAINGQLTANDPGGLQITAGTKLTLAGDLSGNTRNSSAFQAAGTLVVSGGTASSPRRLEVMSSDVGAIPAGFTNNFAYGSLSITSGAYVRLADQADNSTGGTAEALYVGSLTVPGGTTLDLNGLTVYARSAQIDGTILNGTPKLVPDGSQLAINTFTPGAIGAAAEVDDWQFFGFGQQTVNVVVNPGTTAPGPASFPTLNWVQVQLLDSSNHVLATATSASAGGLAAINGYLLSAFGLYKVRVQAAPSHATSIGNYNVAVFDATPDASPLNLNQPTFGNLKTAVAVDRWTFSAASGEQIRFDFLNAQTTGLLFSLTGPNGYVAFTNLSNDSGLILLSATGNYTLTVRSSAGQTGAYAFQLLKTSPFDLPLNTTLPGNLVGSGQTLLYRLVVPAASPLFVQFDDVINADQNELYVSFGQPPRRGEYADQYSSRGGADQSIVVPSATPGTWYVLVYGSYVPISAGFTLRATTSNLIVTGVSPDRNQTGQLATLTISGVGFTSDTTVALVDANSSTIAPLTQSLDLVTQISATFDLHGAAPGDYSLRADRPGGLTSTVGSAFRVTPSGEARLETKLILPQSLGRHNAGTFWVEYANTGDGVMPAPLLIVKSADADDSDRPLITLDQARIVPGFAFSTVPDGFGHSVQILASGATPGVLQPGESARVPVYYQGLQKDWSFFDSAIEFELGTVTVDAPTGIDWATIEATTPHPGVDNAAWNQLVANAATQTGATWGDYVRMLDDNAGYLGRLGQNVIDVGQLWQFELEQAGGLGWLGPIGQKTDLDMLAPGLALRWDRSFLPTIESRLHRGLLGFGWSTPWMASLQKDADGNVTIMTGAGFQRRFDPDYYHSSNFVAQAGDHGVLALEAGGYTLRETDGTLTRFNANGTLDYFADAAGNRVTAGYDAGGRLTKLTHSAGQSLTISYNAAGLIAGIVDSVGRQVTYTYDASQQHLAAVQGFDGLTTRYSYNTTVGAAAEHALTSVEYPDGTHDFFEYDAEGRLSSVSGDNNASRIDISRESAGKLTLADNLGATSLYFDQFGLLAKTVDPLGRSTLFTFDSSFNVTAVTNGAGQAEQFSYDNNGNLLAWTNRLGNTTRFSYGPLSRLTSLADARGNKTAYGYDPGGNLTLETAADNSLLRATNDAAGLPLTTTNARGQSIAYQRNAFGQVTRETFPDGSHTDYGYNGHQNLTSITDASGTTTFSYDAADRLTKVAYPNGRFVSYAYDSAGRQSQLQDQSGYAVNYSFDEAGRLHGLADASGATIVTYSYDAGSRLSRASRGNGTYSTYEYDSAGKILHLINFASNGSVQSRFDYTYNALGRLTSMGTIDGQWTYEYDLEDQLTHASFVSTNPQVPSQDLTYLYDALGNRTTAITNGVSTAYVANQLNQYTQVGSAIYHYDFDGNLTSINDASGTTTYTYDIRNRLTQIVSPTGTTTLEYDAFGNRRAAVRNGARTEYLLDPTGLGDVIGQYDASGNLMAHFAQGLGLISRADAAGSPLFYDFDALGNTADLTTAAGSVANSYSYLPFGESLRTAETVNNPFQFVGQFGGMNEGDSLDYMRARFYSSRDGRFIQRDPIGLRGGDTNLYRYAANRPEQAIDPSGRSIIATDDGFGVIPEDEVDRIVAGSSDDGFMTIPADEIARIMVDSSNDGFGTIPADEIARIVVEPPDDGFMTIPADEVDRMLGIPPPEPGNPEVIDELVIQVAQSVDPNDFVGPAGFGDKQFVRPTSILPYRIDFENDATATAPAQDVEIKSNLDKNFDWSTFELTEVGFGETLIAVPPHSQYFQSGIPITSDGRSFEVEVEVRLDLATGQLTARFLSIDPATYLPPDVLTGLLPPEDGTGRGQGHISFLIRPKTDLTTGTEIHNVALVTFDEGETIATNQVAPHDPSKGIDPAKEAVNTIDGGSPASTITALPAVENATFKVRWSGTDDVSGSGIDSYDVYLSDNGGAYGKWLAATTDSFSPFAGLAGHTYRFYVTAADNVGNLEAAPPSFDATTQISMQSWHNVVHDVDVDNDGILAPIDALLVINYLNAKTRPGPFPAGDPPAGLLYDVDNDGTIAPIDALTIINALNAHTLLQPPSGAGEGEAVSASTDQLDLVTLLATDIVSRSEKRRS